MPISAVIYLSPPVDAKLRLTMGHHAHAAFLSLLRISNPEKAEEIHAASAQKPFTVSPLIGKGRRHGNFLHIRAGDECWLRFTFLDDELFTHFRNAFLTQELPSIRLGHAIFQFNRLVISNTEDQNWGKSETYAELAESAKTDTRMSFRFYSPTAFRKMTPRGQKTRNDAYVDLVRCYQSWINKWNAFAPIELNKNEILDFINAYGQVTSVRIKSQALNFGRNIEVGWVGACACVFYPEDSLDTELLRAVNCLADFAFYCGTGYKTTMGMGQTRRI